MMGYINNLVNICDLWVVQLAVPVVTWLSINQTLKKDFLPLPKLCILFCFISKEIRVFLHGERKILEGETTFSLFCMLKFLPKGLPSRKVKEEKLSAYSSPAATMFVLLVPSTRIFRTKVVYMVLGSS